jgi:hypothetical protein
MCHACINADWVTFNFVAPCACTPQTETIQTGTKSALRQMSHVQPAETSSFRYTIAVLALDPSWRQRTDINNTGARGSCSTGFPACWLACTDEEICQQLYYYSGLQIILAVATQGQEVKLQGVLNFRPRCIHLDGVHDAVQDVFPWPHNSFFSRLPALSSQLWSWGIHNL